MGFMGMRMNVKVKVGEDGLWNIKHYEDELGSSIGEEFDAAKGQLLGYPPIHLSMK